MDIRARRLLARSTWLALCNAARCAARGGWQSPLETGFAPFNESRRSGRLEHAETPAWHRHREDEAENPEGRALAVPFGKVDLVCMVRFRGGHARGGATARGPIVAGWCPHPTGRGLRFSLPGHGLLKTASGFIRHGLGLALTIRERQNT
jgi:hypothetical protein